VLPRSITCSSKPLVQPRPFFPCLRKCCVRLDIWLASAYPSLNSWRLGSNFQPWTAIPLRPSSSLVWSSSWPLLATGGCLLPPPIGNSIYSVSKPFLSPGCKSGCKCALTFQSTGPPASCACLRPVIFNVDAVEISFSTPISGKKMAQIFLRAISLFHAPELIIRCIPLAGRSANARRVASPALPTARTRDAPVSRCCAPGNTASTAYQPSFARIA